MVHNDNEKPEIPDQQNSTVKQGLSSGKYRLVGWAIDTTGRRLIDEICQIAAYTPQSQFSQYIMPYSDINFAYVRKHAIRVVSIGRYRILKDLKTNQFIKTKSEVSALTDFLQWLEKNKGEGSDGIILIYHEARKASPGMLLESLRRYDLLDRFKNVVKGFVNGFHVAESKCGKTTKAYSLRVLTKVLLNKENDDFSNAKNRAETTYEIAVHLAQGEMQELHGNIKTPCVGTEDHLIDLVCPYGNPNTAEEKEIIELKDLLKIQNTFRPVFQNLLKASQNERNHASHLRRLLAENNINYDKLKEAYESEATQGIDKLLKSEVANAKESDLKELLEILDCFFDPGKKPVQPKFFQNNRKQKRNKSGKSRKITDPGSPNASSDNPTDTVSNATSPRSEVDNKPPIIEPKVEIQA